MSLNTSYPRARAIGLFAVLLFGFLSRSRAQDLPSPAERLDALERGFEDQNERLDKLEKAKKKKSDADPSAPVDLVEKDNEDKEPKKSKEDDIDWADGIEFLGGVKMRLGGKAELNFIKTEEERFAPLGALGATDEPDPRIDLQRLRFEPNFELNRHFSVRGQIDFRPTQGDTVLRELTLRHESEPFEWLDSRLQVGVDDRFMRPARRTKTQPLASTAFWRDESMALTWRLRAGRPEGPKSDEEKRGSASRDTAATDAFDTGDAGYEPSGGDIGAFDFFTNPGRVSLFLSLGQGYELNDNEVGFDNAAFNGMVHDNRDLRNGVGLRELGIGMGYERGFGALGRLSILGFYYNDELRSQSIAFLQGNQMTSRNLITGQPIAGYGNSTDDKSLRYGATLEYFLPASSFFEDIFETRGGDGFRLLAQYIQGEDGALERTAWFVQGSYRFSFGRLILDRYVRSLEPVVRYGRLEVDVPFGRAVTLPATWDREELMVGALLEITGDLWVKFEYVFNGETTGGPDVANDELLIQLLVVF